MLSGGLALAFTAPTASYPNNNTNEPVDVGPNPQNKIGSLTTGPLSLFNGSDANFYGDVKIAHPTIPSNQYNLYTIGNTGVAIQPSAKLNVLGNIKAASLAHATTAPARVCANAAGLLSLCPSGFMHLLYSSTISGATCGTTPTGCTWTVPDGVFKIHVVVKAGGGGDAVVKDLIVNPGQAVKVIVGKNNCSNPCSPPVLGGASDLYINGVNYVHADPNSGWPTGYVDITF